MREQLDHPQFEGAARRFMLPFVGLLVASWLLLGVGSLYLSWAGELRPVREVVTRQMYEGGLYGEALRDNRRAYKLALDAAIRPQVVAIGSSRAQEFRGEFFRVPFANLGGGILTFDEADSFIDAMLARGRPKVVIFAVDWWWFDTRREQESRRMIYDNEPESDITLADRLLPFRWLIQGKFSLSAATQALLGAPANAFGPPQGALATVDHTGFRADGSWAWLSAVTAVHNDPGHEFIPSPSPPGVAIVDQPKLAHFDSIVRRMKSDGIKVILFIPPEMSQAVSIHRGNLNAFPVFAALSRHLTELAVPWFDFSDAKSLGSSDCEFIDIEHAGEVLGARMLRAMGNARSTGLGQVTNTYRLDSAISRWQGHAIILTAAQQAQFKERDFLGLGCHK